MTKKIASLALILFLLSGIVLTACGGGGGEATKTQGGPAVPTEEPVDPAGVWDKEIKNLQGHEFVFLVRDSTHWQLATMEVYAEELNGDKVNDAVYKRNALLAEKYNCTVSEQRSETPLTTCREPLMAGEYVWDVLYTSMQQIRSLSASNLMVDLNTLHELDLTKNWWDHNLINGMSLHDHIFYATGDGDNVDDRCSWVIYVNLDILEKNRQDNPYQLVYDGKWTINKMYEMGEACWADLNGDGVFEADGNGVDVAAYIGEKGNNLFHILACGERLSQRTDDGEFKLPATLTDNVLAIWAELKPLLTSPHRDVSDSGQRFRSEHAAFYGCNLGIILKWGNAELNFGILPFPKRNEEQKDYYSVFSHSWYAAYGIPVTVANIEEYKAAGFESGAEMVGYFLDAYTYESTATVKVAFYDEVLRKQAVRDAESQDMLEFALVNKNYDPVAIYNFGSIASVFADAGCPNGSAAGTARAPVGTDEKYDTVTSLYESRLKAARKALQNYLDFIDAETPAET